MSCPGCGGDCGERQVKSLEVRVAALEAVVDRLAHGPGYVEACKQASTLGQPWPSWEEYLQAVKR